MLRELQPVLKTLNDKSNALVFEAKDKKKDPQPKGRNNEKVVSGGGGMRTDGLQQRW